MPRTTGPAIASDLQKDTEHPQALLRPEAYGQGPAAGASPRAAQHGRGETLGSKPGSAAFTAQGLGSLRTVRVMLTGPDSQGRTRRAVLGSKRWSRAGESVQWAEC